MITDPQAMVALSKLLTERNAAFLELDAVRADLRAVATIAHEGGLARLSEGEAWCAIRRLTLCWWVRTGSLADGQERVRAAMLLAKHKETP